jgi:hypothetical protein
LVCGADQKCRQPSGPAGCEESAVQACGLHGSNCPGWTQTCRGGSWLDCTGPAEQCDGEDNDCNDQTDEQGCPDDATMNCDSALHMCHIVSESTCGLIIPDALDARTDAQLCQVGADDYPLGASGTLVHVAAVYVDRYEVTNDRYRSYLRLLGAADASAALPHCTFVPSGKPDRSWDDSEWPDISILDHPVLCVTQQQASDFCRWAGKRLPTRQEWEAAARGTATANRYPWGAAFAINSANCSDCPAIGDVTVPVTQFSNSSSPFGQEQMAGNAEEWVADVSGVMRHARGGSWADDRNNILVWTEHSYESSKALLTTGFRCAADLR